MSDLFDQIMADVANERANQERLWGTQRHPNGTSITFKPLADSARNTRKAAAVKGGDTWVNIMREEVWEAFSETDRAALRNKIIQAIAVGVAWVECLDEQDD